MKERAIIMCGESVRAILAGQQTATRRVIIPQPPPHYHWAKKAQLFISRSGLLAIKRHCRYGQPGDRLWVRETFILESTREYNEYANIPADRPTKRFEDIEDGEYYIIPHYRATEPEPHIVPLEREDKFDDSTRWSSPIFMQKWAARIWLEIVNIRIERLQELDLEDIYKEGFLIASDLAAEYGEERIRLFAYEWFQKRWDSLNAKRGFGWDKNPYVWVIEFVKIEGNRNGKK